MGLRALLLPMLLALSSPGAAQEVPGGEPPRLAAQSPVLTIDTDRLLAETLFGQRLAQDLQTRAEALAAENERLREELTREEQALTERRPLMEPEQFRAEADAFDERVQRIRAEQDAKEQALETSVEEGQQGFRAAVRPVLGRLMLELGAAVILDRRQVILSASAIDVTEEAIAAIDAQLGDGTGAPADPQPEAPPAEPPAAEDGAAVLEGQDLPPLDAPALPAPQVDEAPQDGG